jgi:hypothetical protein
MAPLCLLARSGIHRGDGKIRRMCSFSGVTGARPSFRSRGPCHHIDNLTIRSLDSPETRRISQTAQACRAALSCEILLFHALEELSDYDY